MRASVALLLVLAAAGPVSAQPALVDELRYWAIHYDQRPQKIDELKTALEAAAESHPQLDTLLALAQACFIYGDVRAQTAEDKLAAYDCGRRAAKRATEIAPRSAAAHFWHGTNAGRWGQTKGIMRSLFLLPTVKEDMQTALEVDPTFAPAWALGGNIYYEVPALAGGDLDRSEAMFRKGLELDPRYTHLRVGLARTLPKKGRAAEARRELESVLAEKAPSNPADWAVKDVPQARELLARMREHS